MSQTKILMIGPGDPSVLNSGLGMAAHNISEHLSSIAELSVLQPESVLTSLKNESKSIKKETVEINDFTDFKVISDMVKIEVSNSISPYWYESTEIVSESVESRTSVVRKKLTQYTTRLIEESKKVEFDVIYAHDWLNFEAAVEIKKISKKPLILHAHSLDYDRSALHTGSWVFQLEKEAFEKADRIICVSKYSKKILKNIYGIKVSKIHVVYNGYEKEDYPEASSPFHEKIVLFVGRLTGQKGPTQFLTIAEEVNRTYPDSRFIMAGEGDMYKTLIESGAHSSVASKFHMTGYLDKKELQKLYSMADVYCMPSVSEPFGLTALEACGAEIPVVLSDNAGAAEVLEGARTANFQDANGFAREITNLLKNKKLANESIKRNTKSLNGLSWQKTASQILEILQKP